MDLPSPRSGSRIRPVPARAPGVNGVALLLLTLAACSGSGGGGPASQETLTVRSIEEVQEAHTPEWMDLPGVVGTGIGLCDGQPCIKVFVSGPVEELAQLITSEVEGHRVVLEQTGQIRARDPQGRP